MSHPQFPSSLAEASLEAYGPFLGLAGLTAMIVLSAIGSTIGASVASSTATMVVQLRADLLVHAYIPILLSSTCFLYSIVITLFAIYKIDMQYSFASGVRDGTACLTYGMTALFCGIGIAKVNKKAIIRLSEDKNFFLHFVLLNATIEVPALFALICALLAVNRK